MELEDFQWRQNESRDIVYTTSKGTYAQAIAFAVRISHPNEEKAYLELRVYGSSRNVFIELGEYKKRADLDEDDHEDTLRQDLAAGQFGCDLWYSNGEKVRLNDHIKESGSFPLASYVGYLGRNRQGTLKQYESLWGTSFTESVQQAANKLTLQGRQPRYNVLNRFYTPRNDPFNLYFVFRTPIVVKPEDLQAIQDSFNGVVPVILDDPFHGLQLWSSNPLGLYTTWVECETYQALVLAQTGDGIPAWPHPSVERIEDFTARLHEKESNFCTFKTDSVSPVVRTSLPMWPGEALSSFQRINTKTFMGESANQWATGELGWTTTPGNTVAAEWLHRIAHRFDRNTGDRYSNIIFGTKACNTDMMRAEAVVTQLLASDKIHGLRVDTESTCLNLHQVMDYPRWAANMLYYRIIYQTYEDKWPIYKSPIIKYNPFSKLYPFRFEYELDKIILERFLQKMESEADGGERGPDLLAPYEMKDDRVIASVWSAPALKDELGGE